MSVIRLFSLSLDPGLFNIFFIFDRFLPLAKRSTILFLGTKRRKSLLSPFRSLFLFFGRSFTFFGFFFGFVGSSTCPGLLMTSVASTLCSASSFGLMFSVVDATLDFGLLFLADSPWVVLAISSMLAMLIGGWVGDLEEPGRISANPGKSTEVLTVFFCSWGLIWTTDTPLNSSMLLIRRSRSRSILCRLFFSFSQVWSVSTF